MKAQKNLCNFAILLSILTLNSIFCNVFEPLTVASVELIGVMTVILSLFIIDL